MMTREPRESCFRPSLVLPPSLPSRGCVVGCVSASVQIRQPACCRRCRRHVFGWLGREGWREQSRVRRNSRVEVFVLQPTNNTPRNLSSKHGGRCLIWDNTNKKRERIKKRHGERKKGKRTYRTVVVARCRLGRAVIWGRGVPLTWIR